MLSPRPFLFATTVLLALPCVGCHRTGPATTANPAARAAATPDSEPLVAEAVTQKDPKGFFRYQYVPVTIDGKPYSLLFDTGTGASIYLDSYLMTELGVSEPKNHQFDSMGVGTSTEYHVRASAIPYPQWDTTHTPAGLPPLLGIFGNGMMPHFDLLFDGPTERVRLYKIPPASPTPRHPWLPAGVTPADCMPLPDSSSKRDRSIYFPTVAGGQAVDAWLDSGAEGAQINIPMAKLLGIADTTITRALTAEGNFAPVKGTILMESDYMPVRDIPLMIGTHRVIVPRIEILGDSSQSKRRPFIKYGYGSFRHWLLLVSYSTHQLCLSTPR